jgi:DnaK suppressor protein
LGDGTYGVCDVCGSEIGTERLEAIPWAVRCIDHAGGSR